MTLEELKKLTNPATLRRQLDRQIFETLTAGDDDLMRMSIHAAARWVYAAMVRCGGLDKAFGTDAQELLKGAIEKRAAYELYSRSEVEASAEDKKDDALALLKAVLGDCADTSATSKSHVGIAVAKGTAVGKGGSVLSPWAGGKHHA